MLIALTWNSELANSYNLIPPPSCGPCVQSINTQVKFIRDMRQECLSTQGLKHCQHVSNIPVSQNNLVWFRRHHYRGRTSMHSVNLCEHAWFGQLHWITFTSPDLSLCHIKCGDELSPSSLQREAPVQTKSCYRSSAGQMFVCPPFGCHFS